MGDVERKLAGYDESVAGDHLVAQLLDGDLIEHTRPAALHVVASSALGEELGPPFKRGRGGPGGWVLLDEPEFHLGEDIIVPDLAGWRRERMPEVPDEAYFTVSPDWVCEVLSPSTHRTDRIRKPSLYARETVRHVWLIDPYEKLLEVLRLDGKSYRIVAAASGAERVRLEPFDAYELDLTVLWAR